MKYKCDDYVRVASGFFAEKEGFIDATTFVGWELFGKEFGWRNYKIRNDNESFWVEEKKIALPEQET